MTEKLNNGLSPEEQAIQQEQMERYEFWMANHPEIIIPPEDRRECGPEIEKFEELIASFKTTHSLEELSLIVDLVPEEAPKHPVREPAKLALVPIWGALETLKKETNISEERYQELKAKYKLLSRAVGIINSDNKVDHDR